MHFLLKETSEEIHMAYVCMFNILKGRSLPMPKQNGKKKD